MESSESLSSLPIDDANRAVEARTCCGLFATFSIEVKGDGFPLVKRRMRVGTVVLWGPL